MMKKILGFILFILLAFSVLAQKFPEHSEKIAVNEGAATLFHLGLGVQVPAADLAKRFGVNQSIDGGLDWIFSNNYILGIEGQFLFSNKVEDDPLSILRTPEGDIIGNNRLLSNVIIRERGYYFGAHVGKLFPISAPRSGLRVTLGAGMLRHWIKFQDDDNGLTQITGEYKKGYDRLTGGLALNQFIGWEHLGWDRKSNWMIGFEFNQGFTKSLRDWDFSTIGKLDGNRLDLRFGIRASWTLPFYHKGAENIEY